MISLSTREQDKAVSVAVREALESACDRIAPSWPLDQSIAVNPFWELRHQDCAEVSARVAALADIRTHLPPKFYAGIERPKISEAHLARAADALGLSPPPADSPTQSKLEPCAHWQNISELLDRERAGRNMAWRDEITEQVSQFCADAMQSGLGPVELESGALFTHWLERTRTDRGIPIIMGTPALGREFQALPMQRGNILALACQEFDLNVEAAEYFGLALLMDINGWASWLAYLRWQARLNGEDNDLIRDLLAIRLAWELVLWRYTRKHLPGTFRRLQSLWQRQIAAPSVLVSAHRAQQQEDWLWQSAAELAYQGELLSKLRDVSQSPQVDSEPTLQAVFCIDVRSERIRRHLEAQNPGIQTKGFAGFFGLPLQVRDAGSGFTRPQLPGLLAPTLTLQQGGELKSASTAAVQSGWARTGDSPAAMFSLVETGGPLYFWKLLKDSFFPGAEQDRMGRDAGEGLPTLIGADGPQNLDGLVAMVAGILRAMGLTEGFAPLVLMVGHGSETTNNPHAAGLNCGACGGQSGELNARTLCQLLNDHALRRGLVAEGIEIPDGTQFVAALHETVSDDLRIVSQIEIPEPVKGWLERASLAAGRERAASLGLESLSDTALTAQLRSRGKDWSQVRPEWGLAGNAAFVVAPRAVTRGRNLEGRVFLHDYSWQQDQDFAVLELIMTAPMIVTHWINMQYNASVTDNDRLGSGNKVLHNVVGGHLGVFEGNGGDLRIGLPLQSVHDGKDWVHVPLRLSVFIQAPREAIAGIYEKHEVVRQLVDNQWLYLFCLDDDGTCERLLEDQWRPEGKTA